MASAKAVSNQKKILQEFVFRLKYRNDLPDLPFDPKLLEYPFPHDRLYKYSETSLHTATPLPLYAASADDESGLPVCPLLHGFIEHAFRNPHDSLEERPKELDPADVVLLAKPVDAAAAAAASKSAPRVRSNVPWLRRTEYISADDKSFGRSAASGVETKMGVSVTKDAGLDETIDMSREGQMRAIEATFQFAARASINSIKHPTNPQLRPLEVIPLFPDFEFWANKYTITTYNEDPFVQDSGGAAMKANEPVIHERALKLDEALLTPVSTSRDPSKEWLAMYTPTDATADELREKRKRIDEEIEEDEDKVYDYAYHRDFDYKLDKPNHPYFIELRTEEGGAFYNEIAHRLIIKRRRIGGRRGRDDEDEETGKPTKVHVRYRDTTKDEEETEILHLREVFGHELDVGEA